MSEQISENYRPQPMAVNSAYKVGGAHIAGFLCAVSGTLTVTGADDTDGFPVTLVNAVPVTAGQYLKIPLFFYSSAGGTVQLGGGAAGTLFI